MDTATAPQPRIVVEHVSKWFNKRSSRSLKDAFINLVRGRAVRSQ